MGNRWDKNIKKKDQEWWFVDTPLGEAKIRLRLNKELEIFDHDFQDGGEEWTVFCRITPNERGCTVSWLFVRPDGMPHEQFESVMKNFDKEMEGWKNEIES